jgi:GNAT superfamily N-acetyltransferase
MIVRPIDKSPEEFKLLVGFLSEHFAKEHQMGSLSAGTYNIDKAIYTIIKAIECGVWVAEEDGKIIGSIGLAENSPWYSDAVYLGDAWLYVLPEFRRTGVGKDLIAVAKTFAAEKDKPLILGIYNIDDIQNKVGAYEKLGMKLVGATFMVER